MKWRRYVFRMKRIFQETTVLLCLTQHSVDILASPSKFPETLYRKHNFPSSSNYSLLNINKTVRVRSSRVIDLSRRPTFSDLVKLATSIEKCVCWWRL